MTQTVVQNEVPAINLEDLFARCMGSLDLVERVLNAFEERFEQDVNELEAALRDGQTPKVRQIAHRMKGGASNVAAVGLVRELTAVENQAASGQIECLPESLGRLRSEWVRFLENLG